MSKRRISKRQANRIKHRHQSHLTSANMLAQENLEQGLVISQHGVHVDVEDAHGQLFRLKRRQHLGVIVAGDHVLWTPQNDSGVVVAIQPRKSLLSRPGHRGTLCAVAANIDQLVIVIAPSPTPSLTTIDRYLVVAELSNINATILINKMDLLTDKADHQELLDLMRIYKSLGYSCYQTSVKQPQQIETLLPVFQAQTSVLVGQSGVGKSSIIAKLIPGEEVRVGALSSSKALGKHTTTQAKLYHLTSIHGHLIDSPGIRQFPLWPMEIQELATSFKEFRPFLGQCKFRNCQHQEDPGCRLQQALKTGQIATSRFASFQKMLRDQQDNNV